MTGAPTSAKEKVANATSLIADLRMNVSW